MDGIFICIKAPKKDKEVYITRKCGYAITSQDIVDAQHKYIDVLCIYVFVG